MKVIIKSVDLNSEIGLYDYVPQIEGCIDVWMTFTIGFSESKGGDLFQLHICSPEWIRRNTWVARWGRHMLIVDKYDPEKIISTVNELLQSIDADNWLVAATKISRFLDWEFEDYRP